MSKSDMVSFRCDPKLKAWAAAQGAKRNWSASTFIHELLRVACENDKKQKAQRRVSGPHISQVELENIAMPAKGVRTTGKVASGAPALDDKNRGNCPRCGAKLTAWGPMLSRCTDCCENFTPTQVQAGGK